MNGKNRDNDTYREKQKYAVCGQTEKQKQRKNERRK
jgi:hypothetical protein